MRDWVRHDLAGKGAAARMMIRVDLDPDLVDERRRERDAHIHQAYLERYGPRPESAPQKSDDI